MILPNVFPRIPRAWRFLGVSVLILAVAGPALAFPRPTVYGQIANPHIEGTVIFWDEIQLSYTRLTVRVTAPCGDFAIEFQPGETPFFDIRNLEGDPDGSYTWELIADPTIDPGVADLLKEVRGTPEEQQVVQDLWDAGKLPQGPFRQAGSFEVSGGLIIPDDQVEETEPRLTTGTELEARRPGGVDNATEASEEGGLRNVSGAGTVLTNADGIIRNSLCVGFDCPTSPTFSDTTILLMENNTRIKFDDTSTISGFPNRDWELQANSNASGGGSHFAINDCGNSSQGGCAEDPLFIIEAGAPANSIRVDNGGRVGLKNSNPVVELHISDGDTPTVRLDQTGASGFAPQIWDVAGNETSFFVRDATNGSQLPFRIRPGADSNSLVIDSDNDIGIGILSPSAPLHVVRTTGSASDLIKATNNSGVRVRLENTGAGVNWIYENTPGGLFLISRTGSGGAEVTLDERDPTGASNVMTVDGDIAAVDFNMTSSRELKTGLSGLDVQAILNRLAGLDLFEWSFKSDPSSIRHVGPMAEDFLEVFNLGHDSKHISLVDANGIALAAIQGLHQLLQQREGEIADLEQRMADLQTVEQQNRDLAERLDRLEALLEQRHP